MEAGTLIDRPQNELRRQTILRRKKRKQRSSGTIEEAGQCSKAPRLDPESDRGLPWKNLELICLLQEKDTSLLKKVDLAFDYVKSSSTKALDDVGQCLQVMDTSRTIVFVNNWVQSVLISSSKKVRLEEDEPGFETSGSFLDYRCWKILHFCLEESKNCGVPLTCSKDFLRVIYSIAVDALHSVNDMPVCPNRIQLYDIVLDCISLVFSFHGGVAKENLDLWIMLLEKVLELVLNVVTDKLERELGNFVMQLSCYLFDPFAKFLRVHPTRKTGFQNFIDKLLEPLLHLLHVLHFSACAVNGGWITKLSKLVEEVLAQGLFHPTHIDGFLSLQSTARYKNYSDAAVKDEKFVNKSYHRHLFDKLEKVLDKKNGLALVGLGDLLHLFVTCATRHKGALVTVGGSSQLESSSLGQISHVRVVNLEKSSVCHSMDAELRNSIFDYFVQNLEYLLVDLDKHPQAGGEVSVLLNASVTLRSINNLLDSCICDKLYLRTDDTSEGASRNFLRSTYSTLMAFAAKISHKKSSSPDSDGNSYRELLVSVRKEIIVAVHHLLNIEYEVIGDDLENLWSMVFSSMFCCYSSTDVLGQPLLSSEILRLGCRLIDLYSELRQVDSSIFALLREVRHSLSCIAPSRSCSFYSGSLSMLFCSIDFRLSLSNAINAIPEGQASACIRQLSSDIMESLEWIKSELQLEDVDTTEKENPHSCYSQQNNHLQAEILGKVLCEAYIIILDSITVTSGNSYLVAVSLKNLLEVISPSLSSSLVSLEPDSSKELSDPVNGRNSNRLGGFDNESMCWVLMVLFRLVLSCRSLFRQAIGLMPPNASNKMSEVLGDPFTSHSGRDWLNMKGSADKGFFSWMPQPSATLLEVMYSVSDICIRGSVVLCSPLVYVLNVMALQRLVDLNRLIKSSEYMLQWIKLEKDADLSSYHKRNKKWRKRVVRMRNEAESLVTCMMGFLSSIVMDKISSPLDDSVIDNTLIQGLHKSDALSFATGSLDEKSLASALWWVICQNVDIWCSHAARKDLKNFLTLVIHISIYSVQNHHDCNFRMLKMNKARHLEKVTVLQTALDFLSNTISFEQQFVSRYMASRFCKILQKLVSSIFDSSGVKLSESPNWVEVISAFENSPNAQIGSLPWTKPTVLRDESCVKHINAEFTTCERLLSLLMWMPEEYFTLKSSSMYITYILNLERLLVGSLLGWKSASSSHSPHQIFQLFATCRRVLQTLAVAAIKENTSSSSQLLKSFPLSWLLKSLLVVIGSTGEFPEDIAIQAKVATFSLLDHTSNLLTTVSRDQFGERQLLNRYAEESGLSEGKVLLNTGEDVWKSVLFLAEALKQHLQEAQEEHLAGFRDLRKLSSIIACFQGLVWGLISSVTDTKEDGSNFKTKFSSYNAELMGVIKSCADTCLNFTMFFVIALFLEDDPFAHQSACGGIALEANESPSEKMVPSDSKSERKRGHPKKKLCPSFPDLESFLTEVEKWKLCPKKPLLMQVFRGENAEAGFFLRQLFIACSAILRLNLQIDLKLSWTLFPIMLDISEFLLVEFSRCEMPDQFAYFWLDGTVKFVEEFGSYFPQFDPSLSRVFYESLIGLHLKVIGKCISLQGKEAKLASQEIGSHAKKLITHNQSCFSLGTRRLGQLKGKLRMSFVSYTKRSSELHLLSSIQAVERALVGVQEGLMSNYEIVCGVSDEAEVSSVVAAGIDVLDLILEFVTGPKRLNMVKRHIESLVACLLNIILHLQGPCIFYVPHDSVEAYRIPDSGSVILMSIEVLTRISGKPTLFQMDAFQIAQSLRVPGALFQYFVQLQVSEAPVKTAPLTKTCNRTVDQMFSVELYAACCRMLCNALKHHKSETRQCIALLEDSVSVLLHCLEIVNKDDISERKFFAWEVREAVKCASSLRRVYEEVRQQKEAFGRCSFQFLSRYIWVYCGFGPARNGIIREVDEALKPGVYALIDSCSPDDLQLLHTIFGEGPCRTTLATLQHDYKINFQFEGKV